LFWQSILLSKVLRMQQDLEDEKNEATIKDLENKVRNYEAALKEKDFVIQTLEIKVKDHEAVLEKKNLSRKRRTSKQVSRPKSRRIQICKNH
jgi:hypothetical protein